MTDQTQRDKQITPQIVSQIIDRLDAIINGHGFGSVTIVVERGRVRYIEQSVSLPVESD